MPFIVTCPCGQKNRIASQAVRARCGKCKTQFTPQTLMRATPEAPPRSAFDFEDEALKCPCGWEGEAGDADENYGRDSLDCPDCGAKVGDL